MPDTPGSAAGSETDLRRHVRNLIDYDDARDSAPQEHAAALLGAGCLAVSALRAESRLGAVLQAMAAGALLFRAASGRDGLRRWAGARSERPARASRHDTSAPTTDWRTSGPLASDPSAPEHSQA